MVRLPLREHIGRLVGPAASTDALKRPLSRRGGSTGPRHGSGEGLRRRRAASTGAVAIATQLVVSGVSCGEQRFVHVMNVPAEAGRVPVAQHVTLAEAAAWARPRMWVTRLRMGASPRG